MKIAPHLYLVLLCTCAVGLSSCEKKVIVGDIVDTFGHPLEGATIAIPNTPYTTVSNKVGHYELDYSEGSSTITYSKDGYTDSTLQLTIPKKVKYWTNPVKLYKRPDAAGVFCACTKAQGTTPHVQFVSKYVPLRKGYFVAGVTYDVSGMYNAVLYTVYGNCDTIDMSSISAFVSNLPERMAIYPINTNNMIEYPVTSLKGVQATTHRIKDLRVFDNCVLLRGKYAITAKRDEDGAGDQCAVGPGGSGNVYLFYLK